MPYKETINSTQLEGIFDNIDFPIGKADIIQRAEQEGADNETVSLLDRLPDRIYESQLDLAKEIGKL